METKLGFEVAEKQFFDILSELEIEKDSFDGKDEESTKKKIISAIMSGRLEYNDQAFKLQLLKPLKKGDKTTSFINIVEPTGTQLREMATVRNKNDDVGKGMAVLGSITGLGLPVINKMGSRDLLLSVSVLGLFL